MLLQMPPPGILVPPQPWLGRSPKLSTPGAMYLLALIFDEYFAKAETHQGKMMKDISATALAFSNRRQREAIHRCPPKPAPVAPASVGPPAISVGPVTALLGPQATTSPEVCYSHCCHQCPCFSDSRGTPLTFDVPSLWGKFARGLKLEAR